MKTAIALFIGSYLLYSIYTFGYGQLFVRGKTLETATENRPQEVVTEYRDLNLSEAIH